MGGTDATYGEFPHQIALLRGGVGGSLMCGGSLVSANYVVTAGHCCDGYAPYTIYRYEGLSIICFINLKFSC